jgi:cAMP-specific phosphodiesterase
MKTKPRPIARNFRVFSMRTREALVEHARLLLEREGSAMRVGADMGRLTRFIDTCSHLYHANPYHNWHHAVDVTHTMAWMLTRPVLHAALPDEDRFWLMVAAIAHDLDHPGHNNQWEINIHSPLAGKYANLAVLERHSLDLAAELMAKPEMRFAEGMKEADVARGQVLMRELILATDFAIHKDFLTGFTATVHDYPERVNLSDPDFALMVLKALIKAADIANTTKPFAQAKVWGLRVMQEFWAQGRLEKARSFPIGPLNDEERVDLNQAQAGFIRFAAMDLFDLLSKVEPALKVLVKTLNDNVNLYQAIPPKSSGGEPSSAPRSAKS